MVTERSNLFLGIGGGAEHDKADQPTPRYPPRSRLPWFRALLLEMQWVFAGASLRGGQETQNVSKLVRTYLGLGD